MIVETFQNLFKIPDLRKRIIFTFLMLAVYRVGAQIPTPGINALALQELFKQYFESGVLGFVNIFSGGALERCTIFALGIMPYITASIIMQLLGVVWPYIQKLQKEGGAEGRKKIIQYSRYLTIIICIIHSAGISVWLKGLVSPSQQRVVENPGLFYHLTVIIVLTAGAVFIMWLGEQITARGIGNGISLMIFAGIAVGLIPATIKTGQQVFEGNLSVFVVLFLVVMMVAVVAGIVYFERAQRKIPIQHAKRMVGRRMMSGQTVYLPLKLNPGGVMPIIFAVALLGIPPVILGLPFLQKIAVFKEAAAYFNYGTLTYIAGYAALIGLFTYFYVSIVFNPEDLADNLKKSGGFIPGIRPGKSTSDYIYKTLNRLLFAGAIYLILLAVLPVILISGLPLHHLWGIGPKIGEILTTLHLNWVTQGFNLNFYFGGTSLLIVVGVAMDFVQQIESQLIMRHYEGFSRKTRIRGRR